MPRGVTEDVLLWKQANDNHDFKFGTPDYMDEQCNEKEPGIIYSGESSKFIYLEVQHDGNGTHPSHNDKNDAIQAGLISTLYQIHNYVFKIMYIGVPPKYGSNISYGDTRMRMWLSKYSEHWNSSWGNVIYSRVMYPPHMINPQEWIEHTLFIDGPNDGANFSQLKNLTIGAEEGQFYVESVELSEICAPIHYIQDQHFFNAQDGIPHKAANVLIAGSNTGAPHLIGDVVIHPGANVTFKAGIGPFDFIDILGVDIQAGANFETFFEPCDNSVVRQEYDTTEVFRMDDSIEYMECGDTLIINGLDGDTTTNINYFWDLGNGDTLSSPTVNYIYPTSGTYLVTLVLTDSLNHKDTLSKTYVVPSCRISGSQIIAEYQPEIKVFPNPSIGLVNINYTLKDKNYLSYSVYDPTGRVIINKSREYFSDFQIQLADEGVYFIKFEFEDKSIYFKRIVITK
ncbi:MAG: PKD domain-containing protein [Bacteroidetes bacterium]|nr:PKD domain-containing protein [Bacteroidota bacterium]